MAALLLIGGCSALIDDGDDDSSSSSSSSSSSVVDDTTESVTLSDYVGMGLQEAQDAAQADGLYSLRSTDATGQGRQQLWDRNWEVCSQTPGAGETVSADEALTFDTVDVSEGESCDDPTAGGDEPSDPVDDSTEDTYADESPTSGADSEDDSYSDDSGSTSDNSESDDSDSGGSDSDDSSSGGSGSGSDDSPQAPAGASAQCNDGSYSYSAHRRGTCSHHGGVAVWLNPNLPS
ncbi:DUF3761 domain-containing protein [Streptomyces aurantiacus]|uniref:DUF3761 domain-containing protein n=1 Tax=Streptomyces aurantiacus TaxID=47760 RepID=UPI0006E24A81|nr:DUF3761 domain-containing protein [Streptomyces aurantiacus]